MKLFLNKVILFVSLFLMLLICSLLFIPNNKIKNNSLFANIDKHNRLDSLSSPKIIFVGGSNLAYGLNSQAVEDSLHMPVINMGLHAGFGLHFMMNEVISSINKGDIVVLSPEYHHFYGDMFYGEKVLVALLVDVDKSNFKYLDFQQITHLVPQSVEYAVSKLTFKQLDVMNAGDVKSYESVYKRNSFNKYGDENMHWTFDNVEVMPMAAPDENVQLTNEVFSSIRDFQIKVNEKGARFLLIPPAFQWSSYQKFKPVTNQIDSILRTQGTAFLCSPEKAVFHDSLFFNTVYHLNKKGVDYRTKQIIELIMQ